MISRRQLAAAEHIEASANYSLGRFSRKSLAPKTSSHVVPQFRALPVIVGSQADNPEQLVRLPADNGPCWLIRNDLTHEELKMFLRIGVRDASAPSRYFPITRDGYD